MGYVAEEVAACRQLLDGAPVAWPRNGAASLLLELPLLAVARLGARSHAGEEVVLAMAPVLATAGISTLLYVWSSRLAGSRAWGFAIALAGTFATMLWPYAYIGMEPLQSLLLLAAAFCALGHPPEIPSWRRSLLFGLLAGLALSAKSIGFLLVPAVGYLFVRLFRSGGRGAFGRAATAVALAAAVCGGNAVTRAASWERFGGASAYGRSWLVNGPVAPFLNAVGLLASPNKGLLVFAPLALAGLMCIPAAWRRDRAITVFALLTLAGILGGISLVGIWSDETWGPRYLHAAVAPLLLAFAASRAGRPLRARTEPVFVVAAAGGFVVSALGMLFYYGALVSAANRATTLTLESLQGDLTWNHVRFNARLLSTWTSGGARPAFVERERLWDFGNPMQPLDWKPVELRKLAVPQPLVLRPARNRSERILRWVCVVFAVLGGVLLATASTRRRAARGGAAAAGRRHERT